MKKVILGLMASLVICVSANASKISDEWEKISLIDQNKDVNFSEYKLWKELKVNFFQKQNFGIENKFVRGDNSYVESLGGSFKSGSNEDIRKYDIYLIGSSIETNNEVKEFIKEFAESGNNIEYKNECIKGDASDCYYKFKFFSPKEFNFNVISNVKTKYTIIK